jgi:hypothetical protein
MIASGVGGRYPSELCGRIVLYSEKDVDKVLDAAGYPPAPPPPDNPTRTFLTRTFLNGGIN